MNTILIVEDDININALLKEALEKEGYLCTQAFSGAETVCGNLLDLMLPGIPGEEVLKEIRSRGNTPTIVLTARDTIDSKVEFLHNGADDYITKPFDIKEVLARVEVQIRRTGNLLEQRKLIYRNLKIDRDTYRVSIDGKILPKITRQEFAILELFLQHPKKVFSKEEIFEYAWGEPYVGETKDFRCSHQQYPKKNQAGDRG